MSNRYTIGQLSRETEVPTSTIRFYERRGLLRPNARSQGNYRLYDQATLERLQFVRSAQSAGFTLSDISSLLEFRDGDVEPCCKVQALIEERLVHVREELTRLKQVEGLLAQWLRSCRAAGRSRKCGVLEVLSASDTRKETIPRKRT